MGLTRLFLAQRGLCFNCREPMLFAAADRKKGQSSRRYNREHVVPRSRGGGHGTNIVLSHARCNRERGNALPTPAMLARATTIWGLAVRIAKQDVERFSRDRTVRGTFCSGYSWPAATPGVKFDPATVKLVSAPLP